MTDEVVKARNPVLSKNRVSFRPAVESDRQSVAIIGSKSKSDARPFKGLWAMQDDRNLVGSDRLGAIVAISELIYQTLVSIQKQYPHWLTQK
ncbi:MAG: hypothetical protein F6K35_30420, partial [Okeania sp. SIO2H7]|nr:hypothetical protein [Okeania sp. SIO2H7]